MRFGVYLTSTIIFTTFIKKINPGERQIIDLSTLTYF